MMDGKVILLQRCRPAVEECRPRPHRFEPLECVVIRENLERHRHEVGSELGYRPYDCQALQFGGRVGIFSLVEGSRSAADDALLAIPHLGQNSTEARVGGVDVEAEGLAKVREGSVRASGQWGLESIEGGLTFLAPMKDRILPGQGM